MTLYVTPSNGTQAMRAAGHRQCQAHQLLSPACREGSFGRGMCMLWGNSTAVVETAHAKLSNTYRGADNVMKGHIYYLKWEDGSFVYA